MKKQVRHSVFETNSSSSHSLTMGKGNLVAQPLTAGALRSGVLVVTAGEYGWGWHRYYAPDEKIRYLLTQVTNGSVSDDIAQMRDENERVDMLCRVVEAYTGCKLVTAKSSGYIDHQSAMEDGATGLELFNSEETLSAFIFDADSYIQTGNDNDNPPWEISSCKGTEPMYAEFYRTPPKSYVSVDLTYREKYSDYGFVTQVGGLVSSDTQPELYARLLKFGIVETVTLTGQDSYESHVGQSGRGYAASLVVNRNEKLAISPELKFINELWVDRNLDYSERFEKLTMTVRVPAVLGKQLKALPSTPDVLRKLSTARFMSNRYAELLKETPGYESWVTKKKDADEQIARLEAEAREQQLL